MRAAALAIGTVLLAGCGGSTTKAAQHARPAPGATVVIRNFTYRPANLTVRAGTDVTWRNEDSSPHTATARGGAFSTRALERGQSRTLTLTHAGRFTYVCVFHPFMHATVVVLAR